jgi:hypothetical protein
MTSQEYILSVLKLPFSDEDKAAMIVKLIDAGIKAGVSTVSGSTIGKAPAIQAQPTEPTVAPDLLATKPVTPPAPAVTPAPVFVPASGVTFHAENGQRVDDIVPSGTPGTVTLPATGNVVSVGQPQNGETAFGYLNRVKAQLHATDLVNRSLAVLAIQGWGYTATQNGLDPKDPNKWPEIADRVCNGASYQTQAQKDAAALARQQMISGMQSVAAQYTAPQPAPAPADDGGTVPVQFENR